MTKEEIRLVECQRREKHWKRWGPYLSERAWGTVREDYSPYGNAWGYLPHDHARSRAYRWNEDGLAGICDRHQLICLAFSFWNERDPILKEWFPVNYLLIESLQKLHHYFGDDFKVELPSGSGNMLTLWEVAAELSRRLTKIFLRDEQGRRPLYGDLKNFQNDPNWRDLLLFHEYFHGDTGVGLGASHQTGWTGLVTKLLQQSGESPKHARHSKLASVAFTK
jgi:hypothetical protein